MRRIVLVSALAAALIALAGAQTMTDSTTMAGPSMMMTGSQGGSGDASGMMAPAATGMSGSGGAMMSTDMGYEALKAKGMLADTNTGMMLRTAPGTGNKVIFKDLKTAEALAAKGPVVLFFAADWCPSCQADLRDLNANGARLGKTMVVVVDYDHSAELKAKYGITAQDSFVRMDAMGAKLAIWNGGGVDGILRHVAAGM
jgi:thiol-disulfide isomerase/thioredoxin